MKKIIALCTCLLLLFNFSFGQTTIVLQPNAADGKDVIVNSHSNAVNSNYASRIELGAYAWTAGSHLDLYTYIEFDLASIPPNSVIADATLTFYGVFSPSNSIPSNNPCLSGSNETILQRVTSPWDENTITWNNQPTVTTVDQIVNPPLCTPLSDLTVNVTTHIQEMVDDPSTNNGFRLKLLNENHYRALTFGSSDHSDSDIHPSLSITFAPAAIPTLSEWGVFLLFGTLLALGLVGFFNVQFQQGVATPDGKNVRLSNIYFPFDRAGYFSAMKIASVIGLLGFVFIYNFWGEIIVDDLIGMALAIPLLAYILYLMKTN